MRDRGRIGGWHRRNEWRINPIFYALVSLLLLVFSLLPSVLGQNETFLTSLIGALNGANLTALANATSQIASTAAGPSVLAQLSSGRPYVLFAPTDEACTSPLSLIYTPG